MPTLTERRQNVAANREKHEADFNLWEAEMRRRDEVTDQSERLASPMENTFHYTMTPEGLVTDLGEPLRPVIEGGYEAACLQAALDDKWVFEATRRGIELKELTEEEQYAQAVGGQIDITSFSLDKSDYQAMRAVAKALGHELPVEYPGSEAILQNRMWTLEGMVVLSPIPDAVRVDGVDIGAYDKNRLKLLVRVVTPTSEPQERDTLIKRIRDTYDNVLTARTGQKHYAGRVQMSNEDAKTFIEKQPDLIDAHMEIINKIFALTNDPAERNRLAAPHRYNFAAALDDRLNGKIVSDLSSSGDSARAEGKTFDGDCPTSETATTAAAQAERLGFQPQLAVEILKCVNCPFCRKLVDAKKRNTSKEKSIECLSCLKKVNLETGERMDGVASRTAKKIGSTAMRGVEKAVQKVRHGDIVTTKQGRARYEERLVVGGTVAEYVDMQTGERSQAVHGRTL